MSRALGFLRSVAIGFVLTAVATGAPRTPVPAIESKPHPCRIDGVPTEVLCATYPVWEDRDRAAGRRIGLNT